LSFDVLEDKLGDERKNVSKMVSVHEIFDLWHCTKNIVSCYCLCCCRYISSWR
jgi:hypothetical protein